jgi:hypothetical protein
VKFPPGKGQDESGADVDNFKLALGIIAGLAAGRGVVLENLAGVIDDPRLAAEFAKMSLWDVDFHDAGTPPRRWAGSSTSCATSTPA